MTVDPERKAKLYNVSPRATVWGRQPGGGSQLATGGLEGDGLGVTGATVSSSGVSVAGAGEEVAEGDGVSVKKDIGVGESSATDVGRRTSTVSSQLSQKLPSNIATLSSVIARLAAAWMISRRGLFCGCIRTFTSTLRSAIYLRACFKSRFTFVP